MPKILIVDDEWLTRLEIEGMLTDLGYDVAGQAETGAEAVAMARELNPDLILMDVKMPGEMNGIDAARKIKAELKIPIVFISGYGDPEYIEAAKEIAPFGYVIKPFDERELHAFVEIALSRRKLELKLEKSHEQLEQTNIDLQSEIAARKKTETVLQESQKLYRDIFEKNNAVKWLLDPSSGEILDANSAACEFYQYSHEEITKLRIWDINIESEANVREQLADASSDGNTEFTFKHRLGSGEIRDVQVYTGTLVSGEKKLLHSIIIDITDRIRAEESLKHAHDTLETRVESRTAELDKANQQLQEENEMRERTEDALRESEEHLRLFMDSAKGFVVYRIKIDPKDYYKAHVVFVSPNLKDVIGVSPREEFSEWFKNIHEDDLPSFINAQNESAQSGVSLDQKFRLKGMEGEWRWLHVVSNPVFDSEGNPEYYNGIAIDITEQKEAEQALNEKEQFHEGLLNDMITFVAVLDPSGDVIFVNNTPLTVGGIKLEDIIGKKFFDAFWWTHSAEVREMIKRDIEQCASGESIIHDVSIQTADGSLMWIEFSMHPIHDEYGVVQYLIPEGRDITTNKEAEKALRESEEKYRSMMESMKDPIYICSPDFRVEYMNPAMIRRTGRDATGENCFKALHDLDEKCPRCMHDKAQQGECFESEIVSPKDNHSYHVSNSPIINGDGSISKMTVYRDTTDLKKLETQLQQAQKMEAIGTLAGGIAHDFNNILGGIIGYAELAKMKAPEGSSVIAYLDKMIKSSDRAADLIKQILTLSRQHKQKQRPVQVKHIIKETLSLLRATLPTTIEIRKDLAKDAGVVNADPTQMHQVIMNLGTNAGHAMQENGGVLEVTLANVELDDLSAEKHLDLAAGSYLRLTVSDTGHGMTSEIMERIFDPYFTTKDTSEGTGLGLSVAHGIVKTHGGTITVYSESGKGTTFHVYLPLILEEGREAKESEEPLPTGSECILFIDDEDVLLEIGSQILEQLGYEVVPEKSSVRALELFRAEPKAVGQK